MFRVLSGNLRRSRPRASARWHLDEMVIKIRGRNQWLWRAVDDEGEVLDFLVQPRRCARSAQRLLRKLLKKRGFVPKCITTDRLKSHAVAIRKEHLTAVHDQGLRANNRAENSHQPVRRRERKQQRSSRRGRLNGSCRSTLPSTTPPTSNAIFYPDGYSRSFAPRRLLSGIKVSLLHEADHDQILATAAVNVSIPRIKLTAKDVMR